MHTINKKKIQVFAIVSMYPVSPVILWEKRGLPETNCNKRYFYSILIRFFFVNNNIKSPKKSLKGKTPKNWVEN